MPAAGNQSGEPSFPTVGTGYVYFRPAWAGTPIRVALECDVITRTVGLSPDTFSATCSYVEFDKLNGSILGLYGTIELWFKGEPGGTVPGPNPNDEPVAAQPDVQLGLMYMISVTPEEIGYALGEADPRVLVYRLTFSDHRMGWAEPRGGQLMIGKVNPEPMPDGDTPLTNQQLAYKCLQAMGISSGAPASMSTVAPLRDLDWSAAHAPTELQTLLEHTGHTYAPLMAGPGLLVRPGLGADPMDLVPLDRLTMDLEVPTQDGRAVEVVLTSSPAGELITWDQDAPNGQRPEWKYVAQDPDDQDKWKPLADIPAITANGSVVDAYKKFCKDTDSTKRERLLGQIYRCIQIDPQKYPPGKAQLLSEVIDTDGTRSAPRIKRANVAIAHTSGAFLGQAMGTIEASQVITDANVLVFPHPICTLAASNSIARLDGSTATQAVPLTESNLKPTFTVEAWDTDAEVRLMSVFGFTSLSGPASSIAESSARSRLAGFYPFTAIHHDPSLQVIKRNNDASTSNRPAVEARAQSYAVACLRGEAGVARPVTLRGFYPMELSGRVSCVSYDIPGCRTDVTIDDFASPVRSVAGRPAPAAGNSGGNGGGSISVGQSSTTGRAQFRRPERAAKRYEQKAMERGTNGMGREIEPVAPNLSPAESLKFCWIKNLGKITGQIGRYTADMVAVINKVSVTGNLSLDDLTKGDGVTTVTSTPVIAWFPADLGTAAHSADGAKMLLAVLAGRDTNANKPLVLAIGGSSLPPPGGLYSVLMVIGQDTNGNPILGWDYPRMVY